MKNICAWCKKDLGETSPQQDSGTHQITHGICQACKEYFFNKPSYTINDFLNKLQAPVLMVNEDGDVLSANNQALQIVNKDLSSVQNLRMGNVVECAHARLPEGCGNTVHCLACTIRGNINKTFRTGKSLKRVPAFLQHRDNNNTQRVDYLISTEKVDQVILLRIDEIIHKVKHIAEVQYA